MIELRGKFYNPEGKREPTPITPQAYKLLEQFGLSCSSIARLREIVSAFDYGNCPQRIKALSNRPAILDPERGTITIPHLHDIKGSLTGQCGELSFQLVCQLHFTGFLEDVNEEIKSRQKLPIQAIASAGLSKTHFGKKDNNHVWVVIKPIHSTHENSWILVDPSFKQITTFRRSGYKGKLIEYRDYDLEKSLIGTVTIGSLTRNPNNTYSAISLGAFILGSSNYHDLIYSLTFLKDSQSQKIVPAIRTIDKFSNVAQIFVRNPQDNDHTIVFETKDTPTESIIPVDQEIEDMLDYASRIKFNTDLSKIKHYEQSVKIRF